MLAKKEGAVKPLLLEIPFLLISGSLLVELISKLVANLPKEDSPTVFSRVDSCMGVLGVELEDLTWHYIVVLRVGWILLRGPSELRILTIVVP